MGDHLELVWITEYENEQTNDELAIKQEPFLLPSLRNTQKNKYKQLN